MVHFVYFAANQERYRNSDTFWSTNYLVYCKWNDTDFRIWKKYTNQRIWFSIRRTAGRRCRYLHLGWLWYGNRFYFLFSRHSFLCVAFIIDNFINASSRLATRWSTFESRRRPTLRNCIANGLFFGASTKSNRKLQINLFTRMVPLAVTPLNLDCVRHEFMTGRIQFEFQFYL